MDTLQLRECVGYTKEEAFKNLEFNPNTEFLRGSNCTQAWITEGRPTPGTKQFKNFAIKQLEMKTKMKPGYGLYITLESAVANSRKKPYTVISPKVTTTRHWSNIMYMIIEADIDIKSLPEKDLDGEGNEIEIGEYADITVMNRYNVICMCDSLNETKQKMKELTTETNKDYVAMAIKIPDLCPEAAYCIYTPSVNAKKGKYLAFGIVTNFAADDD